MLHYLKLMVQLILSPARGWEDVASGAENARHTLMHGLLPLTAVEGLTVFIGGIYESDVTFGGLLIRAVVTFAKYALTYFVGVGVMTSVVAKMAAGGVSERERVELFSAYSVGIMAVIGILENLLPMELTLLQFLPLYVIAVMCYGRTFLGVGEDQVFKLAGYGTLSIVLPVYLIDRVMQSAI